VRRRRLPGAAGALLAAGVVVSLVASVAGPGLLVSDELVYASAARDLAESHPPLEHDTNALFVHRFGFPHPEQHARGGVFVLSLVFRLLGAGERAALLPAILETCLAVVLAQALARRLGLGPRPAATVALLVAAAPTVAGFAVTGFHEPALTLSYVLGALALAVEELPVSLALAGGACFLAAAHRETNAGLALAIAIGLLARDGKSRAALLGSGAAVLGAALGLALASGNRAASRDLPWFVAQPLLSFDVYRDGFGAATDASAPAITGALLAARVAKRAGDLVLCSREVAGAEAALLFVHGAAVAAAAAFATAASRRLRAVAAMALALYVGKVLFLLLLYEEPGLNARHLAPESALLLVAGTCAFPRRWLVLLAVPLLAIDLHVARWRGDEREKLATYTAALCRVGDPRPGAALVAYNAHRVPWERPGTFTVLPPASDATLAWLSSRVPVQALVLDANEPLVARRLITRGQPPSRLGDFKLVRRDTSAGMTLLLYEPR
jgi:hypothetical protein